MNGFFDKDLGNVIIKKNSRAKKMIVRRKLDQIHVTIPSDLSKREVLKHFESLKPQIMTLPVKKTIKTTAESEIKTFTFDVEFSKHPGNLTSRLKNEVLTINVPPQFDILDENIQTAIKNLIINTLRQEAKRVLTEKVCFFARKWDLEVAEIKINSSKGRWGSCSMKKNINFSLFLMMLPEYLIDYVVLHELAHTVELNHSRKFWQLLDTLCDGKVRELSKECKNYNDVYLTFLKQ